MGLKYTFSGHESFPCKSLWLKKGYDFVAGNNDFNSPNSVVELGVGKNMVSSIRYWMKSFGMLANNKLTPLAHYIFNDKEGKDPFVEDLGTLWLLHYLLVISQEATLYNWLFTRFQRERKQFDRQQVQDYVKRVLIEDDKLNIYNVNTVKKDVAVLIQNYVLPKSEKSFEDFSSLLIDLDLLHSTEDSKKYYFNYSGKRKVTPEMFLYAITVNKGSEMTVSYDMLQDIGLIFCMNDMEVITMSKQLSAYYSDYISYSDVAGIRQIQYKQEIIPQEILEMYYSHGI